MDPPSALLPTCVPWQGLLLTASLLAMCNVPTTAEATTESVPPAVLEGSSVLLLAHNLPGNLSAYHWFKGEKPLDKNLIVTYDITSQEMKRGKLHDGRETLYPNGSLMLQNVTLKQSGIYNLNIQSAESDQKSVLLEVFVYPRLSKPSIRSNGTTAVEGQEAVELTCDPPFLKTTYVWRLNGKELPGDNNVSLSQSNTTLTLLQVSRHFTGHYECEVQNPLSAFRSNPFTLDVYYGPDTPKIFPPYKYFEEGQSLWLSCQATSYPEAQYSWIINGKPRKSDQEVFIHKVSPSNSGLYTCLVNNPTTGRDNFKVKEVTVVEKLRKPHIQIKNKTVLEHHFVDLTCVSENPGISIWWTFNNKRLKTTDRVVFTLNNRSLTIGPITKEDAGAYQCEVSNPFNSRLSDPVSLAVLYEPSKRNYPISAPMAAALVVEFLAGLAILGGLAYFVFFKKLHTPRYKSNLREDNRTPSTHSHSPHDHSPNKVSTANFPACFLSDVSGGTGDSWSHNCEIKCVPLVPRAADEGLPSFILSLLTCICLLQRL